jgi:hypothetical protein
MRLVPPAQFVDSAAAIVALSPNALAAHTLLISADDETAVQEGIRLGEATGLSVLHSRIDRMQGGQDKAVWMQQSDRTTRFYGHLLQLTLALEADAWIGTRGSNWNRLIDELRCVWVRIEPCGFAYIFKFSIKVVRSVLN